MLLLRLISLSTIILTSVDSCYGNSCTITWKSNLYLQCGDNQTVDLNVSNSTYLPLDVRFNETTWKSHNSSRPVLFPQHIELFNATSNVPFHGVVTGESIIKVLIGNDSQCAIIKDIIHVHVIKSYTLVTIGDICGWLCLFSWGISSYPQILLHFQRRSVAGFSINYLWLNGAGYTCYCLYNIAMFWIPQVKILYKSRYENSENPVLLPDVIMTLHGLFTITILSIQCVVFERGNQKISLVSKAVAIGTFLEAFITLFITIFTDKMDWYQYVSYLSYIKLGITFIKYAPQMFLNYKRKSTVGFSIVSVSLDFSGGLFSLLQLLFEAGNSQEWDLILGDMTKFGLSLLTITFDIVFAVQHFIIYPERKDGLVSEISPLLDSAKPVNL